MSKANKQQVPKIRFEGFSQEWKKVPFSIMYSYIRNGFVGTATPYYVEKGVLYIQGRNIKDGKLLDNGYVNISEEFHKRRPNSKVAVNDLLMVQSGHVGETAVVDSAFEGANCHAVLVATPDNHLECNSYFYNNYFLSDFGKAKVKIITTGNTIQHILSSDLKTLTVPKPIYQEQTQIGNFFQQLDKLIELQTRAVESAEMYKKTMLQKMFPQKGEKVPRVRFEGFSGDWETRKLKELFSFSRGEAFGKKDINPDGLFPCIHYGELFTQYNEVIDNSISRTNLQAKKPSEIGDILMPSSDVTPDGLAKASCLNQKHVFLGGDINILRPIKKVSSVFFSYLISYQKNKLLVLVTGSSVKHLYNSDLKSLYYVVPSFEEQVKIGNFFQKLDQNIESEKKKLEQYQTMKRALLQRMFI